MARKLTALLLSLQAVLIASNIQSVNAGPVTLVPAVVQEPDSASQVEHIQEQTHPEDDLIVDQDLNLVCNSQACYPLQFEPLAEWQEVKPKQQVPPGLDIRINMDTGKKEAKLALQATDSKVETEQKEVSELETSQDQEDLHEFVAYFDTLRTYIDANDSDKITDTLDDLMEFSHDYKHGYKLIKYEQPILMELLFHDNSNLKIVEMTSRLIAACLRNNPPAIESFYPKNVDQLVDSLVVFKNDIVIKRIINILQNVASKANDVEALYSTLMHVYFSTTNEEIKVKVLDILATLELVSSTQFNNGIVKRSEDSEDVKVWFDEFAKQIQSDNLDEYHIRKFYKTLIELKKQTGLKVQDKNFMSWISDQAVARQQNLDSSKHIEERDLEADEFDKLFIQARHEVFGNPKASRMKNFQDEL